MAGCNCSDVLLLCEQMGVRLINVGGEINEVKGSMYFSRTEQCGVHVRIEIQFSWLH